MLHKTAPKCCNARQEELSFRKPNNRGFLFHFFISKEWLILLHWNIHYMHRHDSIIPVVEQRIGTAEASFEKFITGPNTDCCSEMPCSMYVWCSREDVICNKKCTSQQWRHCMQVVSHPQLWFCQCSSCKSYLEESRYSTRLNEHRNKKLGK